MIRSATIHDAPEIARIHVETWQHAYQDIVPQSHLQGLSIEMRTLGWQEHLSRSTEGTLVAEDDGRIIGWIGFGPCRDEDAQRAAEIYAVYVDTHYWRQGHGRELMARAEGKLWPQGFLAITLWVFELNRRTRSFYAKCGFAPDGHRKPFTMGGQEIWAVRYAKHTD